MPTIVIAAGGTAGHVVPALAVADELRAAGADVRFAGTRGRAEAELVPQAGYEISFLSVSGLDRRNPVRAARAAVQAGAAVPAALRLLNELGADAVLGGGGYVAGPVGLAAVARRTPLILSEADSHLGLTNRLLAAFARRVCLAFPIEGRSGARYLVTGRPVPAAILAADRETARRRIGIAPDDRCVLVFGGSLGARSLNEAALEAFGQDPTAIVLHVSGRRDHAALAARLASLGNPPHYRLHGFIEDGLADPLAASDLVIARAGGSVFEIAAAGRPALLVPYPAATADHQSTNAHWMEAGGAAIVIPDSALAPARLRKEARTLLDDPVRLAAMAAGARRLARPDAAGAIAAELLAACRDTARATQVSIQGGTAHGATRSAGPSPRPSPGADTPWHGRRLHFVGIGGAGMSGLALIAHRLGAAVSGCDQVESGYMDELREVGILIAIGHDAAHAQAGSELVVSSAIPGDSPDLAAARRLGLRVLHRTELLAQAAALRRVIAVSGTHGKTTTTAMIAHALERCGLEPSFMIGAELRGQPNARWGGGDWLVVEADESDRSFLRFAPDVAVVTNVELDHHTTYTGLADLERAFEEFLERLTEHGTAVAWSEVSLPALPGRRLVTYGAGDDTPATYRARDIEPAGQGSLFTLAREGKDVCRVRLPVPGDHNVRNALAALAACDAAGADLGEAAVALADFLPAGRRFELRGEHAGARIFDDYAHHPTEVEATLQAARALRPKRLIAAFQPHLYSRTLHMHREFGRALAAADEIVVLDVYRAREHPGDYPGVSGKLVADAAADGADGRPVWWLPSIDEAAAMLKRRLGDGDLLVTLGAGDVDRIAELLLEPAAVTLEQGG